MKENRKIETLKNGKKIIFITIDSLSESEKKKYAACLTDISKRAGQDPGDHVFDWLYVADLIIFVMSEDNNDYVAFSVICIPEDNILHIAATMVIPEYQNSGLGTLLTRKAITYFYFRKIKRNFINFLRIWTSKYILFRTQNPSVYSRFYEKKLIIYPSVDNNKPRKDIINIVSRVSKKIWPYAEFDEETFVLRDAYKLHPFLIIDPGNIPWSKNEKIDFLFKDSLKLDRRSKDALIIIIELTLFSLLKK